MNQLILLLGALLAAAAAMPHPNPHPHPHPDSAGVPPLPGPGLSYGGIPYGSMSGNVAEYFKRGPSSGRRANYATHSAAVASVDYSPIEQWL